MLTDHARMEGHAATVLVFTNVHVKQASRAQAVKLISMNVPVIRARMVPRVLMELIDTHADVLQDGKEVGARLILTTASQSHVKMEALAQTDTWAINVIAGAVTLGPTVKITMLVGQALAKMEQPVTISSAGIHAHVLFTTEELPAPKQKELRSTIIQGLFL